MNPGEDVPCSCSDWIVFFSDRSLYISVKALFVGPGGTFWHGCLSNINGGVWWKADTEESAGVIGRSCFLILSLWYTWEKVVFCSIRGDVAAVDSLLWGAFIFFLLKIITDNYQTIFSTFNLGDKLQRYDFTMTLRIKCANLCVKPTYVLWTCIRFPDFSLFSKLHLYVEDEQ